MEIRIGRDLRIKSNEIHSIVSNDEHEAFFLGEIFGGFFDGVPYDQNTAKKFLHDHLEDQALLIKFIRCSIGQFELIVKYDRHVLIISSPSSYGIFYRKDRDSIILSKEEKRLYQLSPTDLNEMEVLNIVLSHHGLRSPTQTFINGVDRLIGGSALKIKEDLEFSTSLYITKSWDELVQQQQEAESGASYETFFKLLSEVLKSYHAQIPDTHLLLSGGIDSVVLLCLLHKLGLKSRPVHWPIVENQELVASGISKRLNFDLEVINYSSSKLPLEYKLERIQDLYQRGLGLNSFWNGAGFSLGNYCKERELDNPVFLAGQNMDSLYSIDTYASGFNVLAPKRQWATLKTVSHRLRYTESYFRFLVAGSSDRGKGNLRRFLDSMNLPIQEHTLPMASFKVLPPSLKSLERDYINYKTQFLIDPIEKAANRLIQESGNPNVSPLIFNHAVRISKRIRFVSNTPLLYHYYSQYFNFQRFLPVLEGPVSDFLSGFMLNLNDSLVIKRYLHKYFRESFGASYEGTKYDILVPSTARKVQAKLGKLIGVTKAQSSSYANDMNEEIRDLKKVIKRLHPLDSRLVDTIKNPIVRDYLAKLAKKSNEANYETLERSEIMEIERFMNLEVYFRSI